MDHHEQIKNLLDNCFRFAKVTPQFDPTFIESLQRQIDNGWNLTSRQVDALNRIYETWRVESTLDLHDKYGPKS